MKATIKEDTGKKLMVDTIELQKMLDCGRKTATDVGTAANARAQLGRRVFWNVRKVQQYLDSISE